MANNNNNKNCYIKSMVSQYGEYWIQQCSPDTIQRSANRVVKDIARGNIDYEQYGIYFLDMKFLENLIIAVNNELEINTIYLNAVQFFKSSYPMVPNIGYAESHMSALVYIYKVVRDKLITVRETQNVGYLYDTSGILFNYKNHLNY